MNANNGTIDVNNVWLKENGDGGIIGTNAAGGEIVTNRGTVGMTGEGEPAPGNLGTIYTNETTGNVVLNAKDAVIGKNKGTVTENQGAVYTNDNVVEKNAEGGQIGTNNLTVQTNEAGAIVTENGAQGTVQANAGQIISNGGAVKSNVKGGSIGTNAADGVVEANAGEIFTNAGEVTGNREDGLIGKNASGAKVGENAGQIYLNEDGATVRKNTGIIGAFNEDGTPEEGTGTGNKGVIETNSGTVQNLGTITLNLEGGTVDNLKGSVVSLNKGTVYNYGGTVTTNKGKEYYTVDIAMENGSATLGDGFTEHNGQDNWASKGATVILRPAKDYAIQNLKVPAGMTAKMNRDGSWTLTITNPGKLSTSDLVFSGSKKSVIRAQASENEFKKLNKEIAAAIRIAEENGTVTADMKQFNAVLRMVAEAMAERPDVAVTFIFRDGGIAKTITIPAGTDVLSAFGGGRVSLKTLAKKLDIQMTAKK